MLCPEQNSADQVRIINQPRYIIFLKSAHSVNHPIEVWNIEEE